MMIAIVNSCHYRQKICYYKKIPNKNPYQHHHGNHQQKSSPLPIQAYGNASQPSRGKGLGLIQKSLLIRT